MKFPTHPKKQGFTLVELLVVIVIIAALAALSFTVGPKMLKQAKANAAMQNLRQIGPLLGTYAADHEMKLPPAKAPATQPNGTVVDEQWHEACLALLFPQTPPAEFKTPAWWKANKTFIRNPMLKETALPGGWTPLNPGYAMNEMIAENLALATGGALPTHDALLAISTPLAALGDPQRTPLIAPFNQFTFRYDAAEISSFKSAPLMDLLSDGKVPVLFVDGHIETMTPDEYLLRQLFLVPIVPVP